MPRRVIFWGKTSGNVTSGTHFYAWARKTTKRHLKHLFYSATARYPPAFEADKPSSLFDKRVAILFVARGARSLLAKEKMRVYYIRKKISGKS